MAQHDDRIEITTVSIPNILYANNMEKLPHPEQKTSLEAQAQELLQRFYVEGGMEYIQKFVSRGEQIEDSDIQGVVFGIMQCLKNSNAWPKLPSKEMELVFKNIAKNAAVGIIQEARSSHVHSRKAGVPDPPLPKPRTDSSPISNIPEVQRGARQNPAAHYVDPGEKD